MEQDTLTRIRELLPTFSKGQKRIAAFILESYDKAAFMTASKLGQTVGVSESTVVRFAVELGYSGYPSMQKSLQKMIRSRLTSVQRLEIANDQIGDQDVIESVLRGDMAMIRGTLEELDRAEFDLAVEKLLSARRIYVLGARSSSAVAHFLSVHFNLILDRVCEVSANSNGEIFEQIFRMEKGDVLLTVSFPRYSSRTVKAMQFAKDRGATVITLTDGLTSPVSASADVKLIAKSGVTSFVDSLAAPMSVANALIVAVSRRCGNSVTKTLEQLEAIWDEYDVYQKMDG